MSERKLRKLVEEHRQTVTEPALAVLGHVYQALLALPAIELPNGATATVKPYVEPMVDEDDARAKCGIDVVISDGSELELTVINSGWGKSFVDRPGPRRPTLDRGR